MTIAALVTVGWGVLAFGAVYPWAYWPVMWGALVTGVLGLLSGKNLRASLDNPVAIGVVVLAFAVVLQLVPLPPEILRVVSPGTHSFLHEYVRLPSDVVTGATNGALVSPTPAANLPLSLSPRATLTALMFVLTLGVMIVGGMAGLGLTGARRLAAGLLIVGVSVALIAIVQRATYDGRIYGFWESRFGGAAFGPFVNRNHFAGWMVMAVSVGLGYLMAISSRAMRGLEGWRNRLLWLSSPRASAIVLAGLAIGVMGVALVLTLSRSGISCFVVALLIVGACVARTQKDPRPRRLAVVGYLAGLVLVTVVWAGLPAVSARFAALSADAPSASGGRLDLWRSALDVAHRFPVTGTGLNTYTRVTPFFQTGAVRTTDEAHNDYLQLAAEGGLLVGAPVVGLVVLFAREVRRRFRASASLTSYWLRVGAVAGLVAVAAQELVEFSLQLPGNAVMFAALCAIAGHRPDER